MNLQLLNKTSACRKHLILLLVILISSIFSLKAQDANSENIYITALERRGALPQLLAERRGSLYSFAHHGDTLLENKILQIRISLPRGLRNEALESYLLEEFKRNNVIVARFLFIRIIHFDFNSDLLRNDASAELDKIVELMKIYPFAQLQTIVHTDNRGSNEYNKKLAARRGQAIRDYLLQSGIQGDHLQISVSGEEEPVNDCITSENCDELLHQINRRAEFVFNPLHK